jgi:hypothetical protein
MGMANVHRCGQRLIAWLLAAVTIAGCVGPRASVMPMRELPADQQERDRRECEAQAGHADVTKPASHALIGALAGTGVGLGVGVMLFFIGQPSSDTPDLALYAVITTALGASVGAVAGTVAGFSSGMGAAHDEYFTRYAECMRERGYTVFRERR